MENKGNKWTNGLANKSQSSEPLLKGEGSIVHGFVSIIDVHIQWFSEQTRTGEQKANCSSKPIIQGGKSIIRASDRQR